METNQLNEFAIKYGTDKCIGQHGYARIYDKFFGPIKNDVKNLVEVGIYNGGSLKAFRDYFPNATIHGLDINQPPINSVSGEPRIKATKINGSQPTYWNSIDFKADIIIDDASHVTEEQIQILSVAWDSLRPGGYYVIEDTHCSFSNTFKSDTTNPIGVYRTIFDRIIKQQAGDVFVEKEKLGQSFQGDWYITRDAIKEKIDKIAYETFGIYSFTSLIIIEKTI